MEDHPGAPGYWKRKLDEVRAAELSACPEGARGLLQGCHEAQSACTRSLSVRIRVQMEIARLESQIAENPNAESLVSELKRAASYLDTAKAAVETAKLQLIESDAAYRAQLIEERIKPVTPARHQEARELLQEERRAIEAIYETAPISASEYGKAGGRFFGVEGRVNQASGQGDEATVKRLEPELKSAQKEKEEAVQLMNTVHERRREIQLEYEQKLRDLIVE